MSSEDRTSAQADAISMSGGGVYSLATKGAKDVIDNAAPLVLDAISAVPDAAIQSGFTFADMGCADGGTSMTMVGNAIDRVRHRRPGLPVTVVYTDQPRNDFSALVRNIHGLGPFEPYLDSFDDVFPLFSGTSFYRQILPDNSLNVGFSATAMHWLSARPCNISSHVHMVGATGPELEHFRSRAHQDWRHILLNRARELKDGGKLVLVNFCIDEAGRYLGNTGGVNMFDTFNELWLERLEDGRINRDEYDAMTLPQYYNTVEEFRAPFDDAGDPVHKAGLRLEHIETRVVPCPFAAEYPQHGDAGAFAKAYIPTIRSWNESIFHNALSPQRSAEERRAMIEDYYASYERRVSRSPEGHGMDYVHAYMVITKALRAPGATGTRLTTPRL